MILGYLVRCRDVKGEGDWKLQSVNNCNEPVTLEEASEDIRIVQIAYPWMETQLVEVHVPNNLLTFKVDGRVVHVAE